MKQVTVKTKYDEVANYIMLKCEQDFEEYSNGLLEGVQNKAATLLKSKVSPSRWDHMLVKNDADGLVSAANTAALIKESNMFVELGPLVDAKLRSMKRMIENGEVVLVNSAGGYCPFTEDYYTILSEQDYVAPETYTIKPNTKYINLENDSGLETHTVNYLKPLDPNFSFVKNLRNYPFEKLIKVFNEFQENGGDTVYVYTTGMDVDQMYDYSSAIIESGLNKVEFEFNCGRDEHHDEVIEWLQNSGVEVKVIGEDDGQ